MVKCRKPTSKGGFLVLHIRDISLKKRILTAQFLMVFIPVLLLFVAGAAMLGALRLAGTARQNDFAALWPMHGPALSIQYAIDELRIEADKHKELRLKSFENAVSILENAGLSVAIAGTDGPVYVTPGTSTDALARQALPKATLDQQAPLPDMHSEEHHAMHSHDHAPPMMVPQGERPQDDEAEQLLWTRDGLFFSYTSPVTGTTVRAAGRLPFLAQERMKVGPQKAVVEGLLLLIVGSAILFIVCLGIYLSRLLSEQILGPLGALREASARIRTGDLATPLPPMAGDEMGDACRDFDAMRAELRDAREKQARYDQSRKELIAGISHDLATPLTLLKGYADGLLSGLAATEEKREQYAQRIYGAACTMERLVRNLRMFSRLELGRMVLTPEPVALDAYFADYVAEEAPALADRGLVLTLGETPPAGQSARAAIDRDAFARVVDNILGNAIKYKEGETVAMELGVAVQGAQCVLSFADHGPGVPAGALPHLFETFYRTDKARTDTKKGSGLGLAICREIIMALGGRIAASATKGGGLTITIHLPIVTEPDAIQPPETASQEKGDANPQ